ncbi:MAG: GerMN domain-containing protein [Fusobacterium sp.]
MKEEKKEEITKKNREVKWRSLNNYFGFILLITLITGYFYFNRDYTPKKILIKNISIKENKESKLYIYYPEKGKLLNEEIPVKEKLGTDYIVKDTIKNVVLKLEQSNKIPQLEFGNKVDYFILKDQIYVDVPEIMFGNINSPRDELLLLYSFINSLTNIKGINSVRFLIDNIDVEKIKYSNLIKNYTYKGNI